ncbi:MAG: hypothetical protein RLY97_2285 [Pseudomonadota bacterium]|jgi:cell division protein FtsQ
MSQRIRRNGTSARQTAARQGTSQKMRNARSMSGRAAEGVLALLPFSEAQLHRIFLAVILGAAAVLAYIVASFAGLPAMAQSQLALVAKDAGFEVKHIELRGAEHQNELKIYEQALAQRNRAMPLVDLQGLRSELMQLSWVQDARVSRQLPDTLVIDIVERKAQAVLKKADRLVLIDGEGHPLEVVSPARLRGRIVLSGFNAETRVADLAALLEAAPALKPQVAAAKWVGNRRWDLTFRTGQLLVLPEGDKLAAAALTSFARLDGTNRLLGGRVAAFDMRSADKIYMRVPKGDGPVGAGVGPGRSGAGGSGAKLVAAVQSDAAAGKAE